MSDREWHFYLHDMISFAENVLNYCDGFDQINFENTGLDCSNFDVNGFQETTRWHVVVDPSGRSRLVCHFPDAPARP